MKIIWIGQAGLIFDNGHTKIMIDPYLSESVKKVHPENYRRVPVDDNIFDIRPDVMIFTHDHIDHFDPETAPKFLTNTEKKMTVLSPASVWQKARAHGCSHNYVQFNPGTEWTENSIRFTALYAEHSDPYAIGVLIEDLEESKTFYVTGDTLYNSKIFAELPQKIDAVFLPINGVGNNMNMTDASRFCNKINAKLVVPIHFGMFDEINPETMQVNNKLIPKIYEEFII